MEGEMSDESVTRMGSWEKKDTLERWKWLRGLGLFPRRRTVMDSTDELVGPKIEEIENDIPECVDGVEERDLNVVDTTKGPNLAVSEWSKLVTCERPCSKEEWEIMSATDKWKTLHVLKFARHGPKKVRLEESIEKA